MNDMMKKWKTGLDLKPKISVVMAIYNKPYELKMCLEGYYRQSFFCKDQNIFELILADDGSSPEIEMICREYSKLMPVPITYLFQEDKGWGKLRMLNWAVLESRADVMIFTDADCVPHVDFIRSHYEYFNENRVCCGRRVDLMHEIIFQLKLEDVRSGLLDSLFWLLKNSLNKKIEFGGQGLYSPKWIARLFQFFASYPEPNLLGSNFSIHKKWLIEINGFEESFNSPGIGEDTDLERRLRKLDLEWVWITYRAIQFHLWHPLTKVDHSNILFERFKEKNNLKAIQGLSELQFFMEKHSSEIENIFQP